MPYPTNASAPTAVRQKLKGKKLRQWRHVFNSEYAQHGDESRAFASAWSVAQKLGDLNVKTNSTRNSRNTADRTSETPASKAWPRLGRVRNKAANQASAGKITKAEAEYKDQSIDSQHCSICTMFRSPGACTLVKGQIRPGGWCKFFDRKKTTKSLPSSVATPNRPFVEKSAMNSDFSFFVPITKVSKNEDGSCTVAGYCSTPALDLDGEIVSIDAVKKAAPGYWQWRNIRRMHSADAVGVGKELNIDEKGAFLTAKIVNKEAVTGCLEGVYKGFSIGGKKLSKTGNTITEIEWIETSIVDRPANPECKFDVAKSASAGASAYLLKTSKTSARDKALLKLASVAETLAKEGPPAARDGFSLPAKPEDSKGKENAPGLNPPKTRKQGTAESILPHPYKCAAHGVENCAKRKCAKAARKAMKKNGGAIPNAQPTGHPSPNDARRYENETRKRKVGRKERKALARQGKALPGGGFPIKNKDDLDNARQAVGRAKNPGAARALIRRRARELGVKLPDKWTKKFAHAAIAKALALDTSSAPSFLSLRKVAAEGELEIRAENSLPPVLKSGMLSPDFGNDGVENFLLLKRRKDPGLSLRNDLDPSVLGEFEMNGSANGLDQAILDVIKRAAQPSRAQRIKMARDNLKKANEMRKSARSAVEDAHKMLKAVYLSKAAKKNGKVDDNDDDDAPRVMSKLQKAYGEIEKLGTFVKAAREQLSKVSRAGQRGQEAADSEGGFYEVPAGVKDLTPEAMASASPGGRGGGSMPPAYPGSAGTDPSAVYSGKIAKFADKNGRVSAEVAELLAENARLETSAAIISRGAPGRPRPYNFDMTKFGTPGASNVDPLTKAVIDSKVNPALLAGPSVDETGQEDPARKQAAAKVVGTYLLGGSGKPITSPDFRGGAAA